MTDAEMVGDITDDVTDVARVMSALAPWGDDVAVDETAGFPVLFARRPGRMSGGLIFRVGWADERLSRAGITHLIEHLALSGLHESHFPYGGVTRELTTHFYAQGTSEQIVTFLNGVTSALGRGLPWERIPREKNILQTEELGHSWAAAARHRLERHGAQGRGLNGYGAAGLDAITEADVREWLARYFTGGNVIGWISGEHLPEGLEAYLPTGIRRAVSPLHHPGVDAGRLPRAAEPSRHRCPRRTLTCCVGVRTAREPAVDTRAAARGSAVVHSLLRDRSDRCRYFPAQHRRRCQAGEPVGARRPSVRDPLAGAIGRHRRR
ncbi:MAG: hypothetical protein PIR02_15150 [Microbacterium enclense]